MQLIGCTKKLQKEMGLGVKDLDTLEPEVSSVGLPGRLILYL